MFVTVLLLSLDALLAMSCPAGNATYFGADGAVLSEAEYEAACAAKSKELNELRQYLAQNSINSALTREDSPVASHKAGHPVPEQNYSITLARDTSDRSKKHQNRGK